MKVLHTNKVAGLIKGVSSCTAPSIWGAEVLAEFSSLNSPYVSRREIGLEEGHEIGSLVVFYDTKGNFMAIEPFHTRDIAWDGPVVHLDGLPASLFRDCWRFPVEKPHWAQNGCRLRVTIPDTFAGINEHGHPGFMPGYTVRVTKATERPVIIDQQWGWSLSIPKGRIAANTMGLAVDHKERFHWLPLEAELPRELFEAVDWDEEAIDLFLRHNGVTLACPGPISLCESYPFDDCGQCPHKDRLPTVQTTDLTL